jgi:hypothetical protein
LPDTTSAGAFTLRSASRVSDFQRQSLTRPSDSDCVGNSNQSKAVRVTLDRGQEDTDAVRDRSLEQLRRNFSVLL